MSAGSLWLPTAWAAGAGGGSSPQADSTMEAITRTAITSDNLVFIFSFSLVIFYSLFQMIVILNGSQQIMVLLISHLLTNDCEYICNRAGLLA